MYISYTYIKVFINSLNKIYYFEPTMILKARKATKLYYQIIFKLYNFFRVTISD